MLGIACRSGHAAINIDIGSYTPEAVLSKPLGALKSNSLTGAGYPALNGAVQSASIPFMAYSDPPRLLACHSGNGKPFRVASSNHRTERSMLSRSGV